MNKRDIQFLYAYNRWANARILEAVSALSAGQFTQDLGSSHRSVRDTLVHIVSGEWIWLQRWQGQSPKAMFDPANFPDLATLHARWAEVAREQAEFVQCVTEKSLKKAIAYENLQSETWRYPLAHMMQHVVNHSTYHRGQVTGMLRQLDAEPAATDFLIFIDLTPASSAEKPPAQRTPDLLKKDTLFHLGAPSGF
jgi:uncharacterized damage-inducible protein DinB